MGLPGSGKSTWLLGKDGVLSSDELRWTLSDDRTNQTIHRRVFAVLRYLLRHRLELRRPVSYIDATNLTVNDRRGYIALADLYDAEVEAVFFDVPIEECQRRNRARDRIVPDQAIQSMAGRMTPPAVSEGFSRVTVVT